NPTKIYKTDLEHRKVEVYLEELEALLAEGKVAEEELEKRFTMDLMTVQNETEVSDCYGVHLEETANDELELYVSSLISSKIQKTKVTLKDNGGIDLKVERLFSNKYAG